MVEQLPIIQIQIIQKGIKFLTSKLTEALLIVSWPPYTTDKTYLPEKKDVHFYAITDMLAYFSYELPSVQHSSQAVHVYEIEQRGEYVRLQTTKSYRDVRD